MLPVIIQCYVIYPVVQIVLGAAKLEALSVGAYVLLFLAQPINVSFLFSWNNSLLSGATRCSRLILYIPCPSFRIIHFSTGPWFPLLKRECNQKSRSGCWVCSLLLGYCCLCVLSAEISAYVVSIYLCIFINILVYTFNVAANKHCLWGLLSLN